MSPTARRARSIRPRNAEDFEQLFRWYDAGLLKPVIGHHFPLDQGAEALRVVTNRGALGKVIIDIGDSPD